MPQMRLCCGLSELQHLADVSSPGPDPSLPYLCAHRAGPGILPELQMPQSEHPLCRALDAESRGGARQNFSTCTDQTDGFRCAETEGRFQTYFERFPRWQN